MRESRWGKEYLQDRIRVKNHLLYFFIEGAEQAFPATEVFSSNRKAKRKAAKALRRKAT
jgi:hypothetical protein